MPKYKRLPPPDVLKVHGELSLKQGWYKTGKVKDPVTDTDTVLEVYVDKDTDLTAEYSRGGKPHREDGPAYICANGTTAWYLHGKLHREDGPAIIWAYGNTEWYLHGKYHREDGPAKIYASGDTEWYLHGALHREDGPAVIWANGAADWWLHGERYSKQEEYEAALAELKKKRG